MSKASNDYMAERYKSLPVEMFRTEKEKFDMLSKKLGESKVHIINRLLHDEIKKVLGEEYIYPEK